MGYRKSPAVQRAAREHIDDLFKEADKAFLEDPLLADKYVRQARRIAMRHKVSLRQLQKRRFCKHCYSYLRPGVNSRVRLHRERVIILCFGCRRFMRIPYATRLTKKHKKDKNN